MDALRLSNVVVGYGAYRIAAIDGLSIHDGEVVGLVGRSGCGKTTLLRTVAGMADPLAGELLIRGERRDGLWRARHTALTQQNFPLFHWLTVRQNLELAARVRKASGDLDDLLAQFSASHLAGRYPGALSGGERCRASLAQAVVARPAVMLLDEPFTGLDTIVKEDIAQVLLNFAERHRVGVLLVTHDLRDACEFAHRVVVLAGAPESRIAGEVSTSDGQAVARVHELLRNESAHA